MELIYHKLFGADSEKENNHKKKIKNINMWKLNNMLLNNQWITEEIKKIPREKWKWNHDDWKPIEQKQF